MYIDSKTHYNIYCKSCRDISAMSNQWPLKTWLMNGAQCFRFSRLPVTHWVWMQVIIGGFFFIIFFIFATFSWICGGFFFTVAKEPLLPPYIRWILPLFLWLGWNIACKQNHFLLSISFSFSFHFAVFINFKKASRRYINNTLFNGKPLIKAKKLEITENKKEIEKKKKNIY